MNKRLKATSCALAVMLALSITTVSPKVGPFGLDAVSAATGAAPTPTPAKPTPSKPSTPSKSTSSTKSNTSTKSGSYSTSTNSTGLLRFNSVGSNVKLLQTALNNKGYKLAVDGIFGKLTLAAVKNFQSKNGLSADGLVGPATLAKVNAKPVKPTPVKPKPVTQPTTKGNVTVTKADTQLTNTKIIGNVTVSAANFTMSKNAKVEGNVYFTTQEAKDTFKIDATSSITGTKVLTQLDAVTTASIVRTEADLQTAISTKGGWITAILNDIKTTKELVLDGDFMNKKTPPASARKLALYSQDDKHVTTRKFTLTAPKLTIKSPDANITKGTFKGDVYVSAINFQLIDARVEGNVYFTTQAAKDSFKMDATSVITGKQILSEVDAVTTASIVRNEADLQTAISTKGGWITAILNDITTTKELVLDGAFMNKKTPPVSARKLALYSQDDKYVVTRRFTLTAPKFTVKSPDANISKGIFVGDVYVSAKNFQLIDAKVVGNVYFTTAEAQDSFKKDATSSITGVQELKTN